MKVIVRWTAMFETEIEVGVADLGNHKKLMDAAASDVIIPEDNKTQYVSDTWEIEGFYKDRDNTPLQDQFPVFRAKIGDDMIKGICTSNSDEFRQGSDEWPEVFVSVPRKGEIVESSNGNLMRVLQITHKMRSLASDIDGYKRREKEPYIIVYLAKIC